MGYNVVLKNGAKEVLNFWVSCFSAAEGAIFEHLARDRRNRATITDAKNGDFRSYYFVGDKLNISVF